MRGLGSEYYGLGADMSVGSASASGRPLSPASAAEPRVVQLEHWILVGMVCLIFFVFCNQIKFDLIASAGHSPAAKGKNGGGIGWSG